MKITPQNAHARGKRSEALVEQALCQIVESGATLVKRFIHSAQNSLLDRHDKDFVLDTGTDKIPLQVKSSERGRRKFENRHRRYGEQISVIVVRNDDTPETLISRIMAIIRRACQNAVRKIETFKCRATLRRKERQSRICHPPYSMAH